MNAKTLREVELDCARHTALVLYQKAVQAHHPALITALQAAGYAVDPVAAVRLTLRLARSSADASVMAALHDFEQAIRPSLTVYVRAVRSLRRAMIDPQVHFVTEHFAQFTEVPIAATRIQRVVIWCRRTYRAIREAARGHEHRGSRGGPGGR